MWKLHYLSCTEILREINFIIFESQKLDFEDFLQFLKVEIGKNQNSETAKRGVSELLESLKLISRK